MISFTIPFSLPLFSSASNATLLKKSPNSIFNENDVEKLHNLLKEAIENNIDRAEELIKELQGALTDQQVELLKVFHERQASSIHVDTCWSITYEESTRLLVKKIWIEWKKDWPVLINYVFSVIHLFIDTLHMIHVHKTNLSFFERWVILGFLCSALDVPRKLAQALTPFLGTEPRVYVIAYGIIASLGLILYGYQKLFRPPINDVPHTENMIESYKQGEFEHRIIDTLALKEFVQNLQNGNVMLKGAPGTGKTSLVEALVQQTVEEEKRTVEKILPESLQKRKFFRVDCKALAENHNKSDALQKLRDEIKGSEGKIVLFFDEIQMLFEHSTCLHALKTFFQRKDLICIGATTPLEWGKMKNQDSEGAFSDRWVEQDVQSASKESAEIILFDFYREKSKQIYKETQIRIPLEKSIMGKIVAYSQEVFPDKAQPRNAVRCLKKLMNACKLAYSSTYFMEELEIAKRNQMLINVRREFYQEMFSESPQSSITENDLKERKDVAKRIQVLKDLEVVYAWKSTHLIDNKELEKSALLYQHYFIPELKRIIESEINKWKDKMDLIVNESMMRKHFPIHTGESKNVQT